LKHLARTGDSRIESRRSKTSVLEVEPDRFWTLRCAKPAFIKPTHDDNFSWFQQAQHVKSGHGSKYNQDRRP